MHVERLGGRPDLLALHAHDPGRYPFLLESCVPEHTAHARWDILFAFPGARLWREPGGRVRGSDCDCFLGALDRAWKADRGDAVPGAASALPFRGGWFLFCGYELADEIEPVLDLPRAAGPALPEAFAVRIPLAVLHDRVRNESWLVAEPSASHLLDAVRADLGSAAPLRAGSSPVLRDEMHEDPGHEYIEAVERARRYIYDGDIFQANLSRTWHGELADGCGAIDVYARFRAANPAPFSGLARWSDTAAIVSSSPERLVRTHGARVETRPIAGTRPRGMGSDEDLTLSKELLAHPKERAEHVMLIDLERNDIGRIAVPGSVQVDEMMVLESYASVHHIVSNVCGELRPGTTPGAVIAAVFPGGTITGCPKVRCMEIIAELEREPRGAYTGSFGYLNRDGDMDMNILIRTLVVDGGRMSLRAGAGIVADSDPQRELEETRAKARGMLDAMKRGPA